METNLTVVYPDIRTNSGTKSYSENTLRGLMDIGINFNSIPIRKREITISGKPYFGILFQYLSSITKTAKTRIVHSLSPDVVIKGTNVVTIHDIIPFIRPEIYMKTKYDRLAYKISFSRSLNVESILVSTNVGKEELIENLNFDPKRIRVVPHSIDHGKFYPTNRNPFPKDGKINVIMVSDFNPRKRIDKIIKAIGGDSELNFYHIGPVQGWYERYLSLKKMAEPFSNIRFLGPQSENNLRDYLSFTDLFLYLSDSEGFGLPPLEAMACGSNVLVNDLPVFKETMDDYAHFTNLSDFSRDDIVNALKSKREKRELIEYSKRYSIKRHALSLQRIYELHL